MIVMVVEANGMLSFAVCSAHSSGAGGAVREVDREQAGEEHDLAAEPHDRADRTVFGRLIVGAPRGRVREVLTSPLCRMRGVPRTAARPSRQPDGSLDPMLTEPTWPSLITDLLDSRDLSIGEASWAMREVIAGARRRAQLAGFLVALRAKGGDGRRDRRLPRRDAGDARARWTSTRWRSTSSAPAATASRR